MNTIPLLVLDKIFGYFHEDVRVFFRLVCKRWSTFIKPGRCNLLKLLKYGNFEMLKWIEQDADLENSDYFDVIIKYPIGTDKLKCLEYLWSKNHKKRQISGACVYDAMQINDVETLKWLEGKCDSTIKFKNIRRTTLMDLVKTRDIEQLKKNQYFECSEEIIYALENDLHEMVKCMIALSLLHKYYYIIFINDPIMLDYVLECDKDKRIHDVIPYYYKCQDWLKSIIHKLPKKTNYWEEILKTGSIECCNFFYDNGLNTQVKFKKLYKIPNLYQIINWIKNRGLSWNISPAVFASNDLELCKYYYSLGYEILQKSYITALNYSSFSILEFLYTIIKPDINLMSSITDRGSIKVIQWFHKIGYFDNYYFNTHNELDCLPPKINKYFKDNFSHKNEKLEYDFCD